MPPSSKGTTLRLRTGAHVPLAIATSASEAFRQPAPSNRRVDRRQLSAAWQLPYSCSDARQCVRQHRPGSQEGCHRRQP